jgi:hypothetical protein
MNRSRGRGKTELETRRETLGRRDLGDDEKKN